MTKILFVITKSEMGGAQRFLYELTTHLDAQKYDVLVAAGGNDELFNKLEETGIKTARIRNFSNAAGIKNFLLFWEIFLLIKKFNPDILYLLSSEAGFTGSFAGSFYRLLFWRQKPKIIYRIGGWAFKEPKNILIRKLYLRLEKISAPFKDVIIVNSEFDRQLGIKNKIAGPEKIITIYNGLDFNELKFLPKEDARNSILSRMSNISGQMSNVVIIGTIANFYKNKGLEFLIKAMSRLRQGYGGQANVKGQMSDVMLLIIGDGPERKKLEKLIGKLELKNHIVLIGAIPDAYQYLKAFDLFVLSSIKEGQPWVILEAMAAGLPIAATNIAGIPEMLENEKSGLLIEPADAEALAKAIEKMLTHPSLAQDCARSAFHAVKEKFTIEEMIQKNEELF